MKLRFAALALAFAFMTSVAAHAQGAIYPSPVADRISNSKADPGLYSFLGAGKTSQMFYGVQFGGYYDIPMEQKQFEVGIDLRDAILHGNNALINTFLFGPRIAVSPFKRPFHPYVEPFIGVGTTRAPNTAIKVNKPQYGVFIGGDYAFSRHVSWRVVEFGYSSLDTASGGTIGASESIPSATVLSFSSGLTFRLP